MRRLLPMLASGFWSPRRTASVGIALMLWDPKTRKVVGLNGSGKSPAGLSLDIVRARAKNGLIPTYGAVAVSVPGTVDAWWELHRRYGKLPWKKVLEPAIAYAEEGEPVAQTVAY